MKKIILSLLLITCSSVILAQIIPFGSSRDSIPIPEIFYYPNEQGFDLYKPINYDPLTSPIWFVMHGQGGTGAGTINNLMSIANRRNALMVGLSLMGPGTTMQHQNAIVPCADTNAGPNYVICIYSLPGTVVLKRVYNYLRSRENRNSIPCYLSGFSAGGQFVSRYMLMRQAYPDSIPIQMSLSMSPLGYTFPTDTFLGVPQPYVCGLIMPNQPNGGTCPHAYNIYGWKCKEHVVQYYNENYAVCVGNQDIANQLTGSCYDITGANRLERARTFYDFGDSNAVTLGTSFNWQYAEIPGAGHDEYSCFQTKWLPTDTSTIAERILFETPYNPVPSIAPVAYFYPDDITIAANDTVFFNNVSLNSTSYYWEFGDSTYATSTLINPYHVYTMPGTYSVELTASNAAGCDNWYKRKHFIHVTGTVGLMESKQKTFHVSPNPNNGAFILKLDQSVLGGNIFIYSIEGKLVYSKKIKNEDDVSIQLPSDISGGMYLMQLNSERGVYLGKLLLNR